MIMGKEVVNRRENLLSGSIPPEIPDVSSFLTAKDYATDSTGGVIKVDSAYALDITSGGKLKGKEIAFSDYASANDSALISKATLDNVVENLPSGGIELTKILDANYPDYLGGVKNFSASYVDAKLMIFVTTKSGVATSSIAVSPVTGGKYSFTGGGAVITATLSVSDDVYKVTFNASGSPTDENIKIYII